MRLMPSFAVETPQRTYSAIVERGVLGRASSHIPESAGTIFVVTTRDVWEFYGDQLRDSLADRKFEVLFFPGGEERKRIAVVEAMAEQMVERGADRSVDAGLSRPAGGGAVGHYGTNSIVSTRREPPSSATALAARASAHAPTPLAPGLGRDPAVHWRAIGSPRRS